MELNRPEHTNEVIDEYVNEAAMRRAASIDTDRKKDYAELWSKARSGIEQTAQSMQAKLNKQPFTAVMGALALGMIIGALAGRRR